MRHLCEPLMKTFSYIFQNRFNTFYFRQKTPKEVLFLLPRAKKEVKISLKTKEKASAFVLARQHKVAFDGLFSALKEVSRMYRQRFENLDYDSQQELLLEQRALEAINDQRYTQQLFFLFERKDRIKNAFKNIERLKEFTLNDIDFSTVDKINQFVAIIDLLSDPTLSDPLPYVKQISFKQDSPYEESNAGSKGVAKAIHLEQFVIKRQKKIRKEPTSPSLMKRQSTLARKEVGRTFINMLDTEISTGLSPIIKTECDDVTQDQEIILEGVKLESQADVENFARLCSLLEKGAEVTLSDIHQVSRPIVAPKTMLRISEVLKKFRDERKSEWKSEKTLTTNESIYSSFAEITNDVFASELSIEHCRDYIEILQKLPANRNKLKQFRNKTVAELLEEADTFTPMAKQNVNKYIRRLSEAFGWATSRGYITANYFKDLRVKDRNEKVRSKDQRQRFSHADLITIFSSNEYVNAKHNRTFKHWLPLLGLYTGARLEELCQLRFDDIRKESGIWVIDINEKEDKRVKTINSPRLVPIHKTLIKLGFIKYVEHLKLCYQDNILLTNHVFPDIVKGRDGYGHNPTKRFSSFIEKLGIKEEGKSFHSFRHTFADESKQNHKNPVMTAELMGHAVESETVGRYGKDYAVSTLKKAIDEYEPLPVSAINKIRPFFIWKELQPTRNQRSKYPLVSTSKSILKSKTLMNALNKKIKIK